MCWKFRQRKEQELIPSIEAKNALFWSQVNVAFIQSF